MLLRCSAAPRWARCGLSPHLADSPDALPDDDTEAAREGTCAAWVAEQAINGGFPLKDYVGRTHQNGWIVDEDMVRHLKDYVTLARSRTSANAERFLEHQVSSDVRIAGTSDLWSWDGDTFCIDDLKYGFEIVEPTSKQLLAYLTLILTTGFKAERFRLGIYQPRALHPLGPYRTIEFDYDQAIRYRDEILDAAGNIARREGHPGDHCKHCPGANICGALTHTVYSMWDVIDSRSTMVPSPQQLSDELTMLERMKTMLDGRMAAVQAETEQRIRAGEFIPGRAMIPTMGKRQFTIDGDAIEALTGVSPWDRKLCTPAELERRKVPKEVVQAMSTTPIVGYKVRRADPKKIGAFFK